MDYLKATAKQFLSLAGLTVSRRDRLAEQIPGAYLRSAYLPPIYRQSLGRLIYFSRMFEQARDVPGDLVECGVSVGTGILNWALLSELSGCTRQILGFDSFAGFPPSIDADRKADGAFQTEKGDYASPPELVLKVLEDGRVSPQFVRDNVRLIRGFFDQTVKDYGGRIALLHLDCDLYESYVVCLNALYPRVVTGGIIMFDEYEDLTFPGAKIAVDEFLRDKPERLAAYNEYGYLKYHIVKS